MGAEASPIRAYRRVNVQTASQGKLIVMMFNGAIQRAEEAKRAIASGDRNVSHQSLLVAQDIISELRSALNMNTGELSENLDRTYEYMHHLLVTANIKKDTAPLDECIKHMASMRDTWSELFEQVAKDEVADTPPAINQHGASVMNLEG